MVLGGRVGVVFGDLCWYISEPWLFGGVLGGGLCLGAGVLGLELWAVNVGGFCPR